MREKKKKKLKGMENNGAIDSCIDDLDRVIRNAEANDWVVNYWSR